MLGGMSVDTIQQARRQLFGGGGALYPGALGGPADWLRKTGTTTGITTGTGIIEFDLERVAKRLFPAHAPLRNEIPRVGLTGLGFGTLANWRALINIDNSLVYVGVSEGKRGAQIQYQEKDFSATYVGLGAESFVNFEAEYAALGYDDILDTATVTLLQKVMVGEEFQVLFGNPSSGGIALGTTPTPTVTDGGGSGSPFTATLQSVVCAALTPWGQLLAGGLAPAGTTASYTLTNALVDQQTRTNADGSTDTVNGGHAILSAAGTVTPTSGHNVQAVVAGVKGAAAYAWYVNFNAGATWYLAAITPVPKVVLTQLPNTANQTSVTVSLTNDRSAMLPVAFAGLTTLAFATSGWATGGIFSPMGSMVGNPAAGGAYYTSLASAPFTYTGNSVNELDTALRWMWDNYRIYPDEVWVSGYQAMKMTNGITTASAPTYRIELQNGQQRVTGGALVTQYINKFALGGATTLPIRIHPYLPDSWCFLNLKTVTDKYPIANVTVPARIKARREYYSVAWPVTTRQRQYGVYVDEVLEHYMPFAMGMLQDIA